MNVRCVHAEECAFGEFRSTSKFTSKKLETIELLGNRRFPKDKEMTIVFVAFVDESSNLAAKKT